MADFGIQIPAQLVSEIIVRSNGRIDVTDLVGGLVQDFLDRTRGDPLVWSEEHAAMVSSEEGGDPIRKYGHPERGYKWQNIFLPNGTILRIKYKGDEYFAEVRHQTIYYNEQPCSPSQFANRVANNTARNAWHDIWIRRATDKDWVYSDSLRLGFIK